MATNGKKINKLYVEHNIFYGCDLQNKTIMIYGFEPLRLIEHGDFYSVVKKRGRGQRKRYLVKNDLLKWEV